MTIDWELGQTSFTKSRLAALGLGCLMTGIARTVSFGRHVRMIEGSDVEKCATLVYRAISWQQSEDTLLL